MSELAITRNDNKIVREAYTTIVRFNPLSNPNPVAVEKKITQEKILVINFNNGERTERIEVHNLAEKRGNLTKEQLLNRRIIEGKGHIMILDKGVNRIIRVSNIISVETEWRTIR